MSEEATKKAEEKSNSKLKKGQVIEEIMMNEKCHILVLTEAKRPEQGFGTNVLNEGFGWGKLHELDAYWIGTPKKDIEIDGITFNCGRAINGVMFVFTKKPPKKDFEAKSFSDHLWGKSKDIAKATSKMAEMVFNTSSQATTKSHPNNQENLQESPGTSQESENVPFENYWMGYLRKQYYEDLETRMLHCSLQTEAGVIVHIFGCYVKTNNNTKESEQCAIIFFLKLNRIIKKQSAKCKKCEFVIVCGDINAEIGPEESDSRDSTSQVVL